MKVTDGATWCGIDIGTTNVKALLIDASGEVLARASAPTPRVSDALGPCTDVDQLFDLVENLIEQAWRDADASVAIAALCCGGVGEDGVPLDVDLRPLDLSIPWNDRRAADQAGRLAASPLWREARLPVQVELTRTAAKWAWLRDHRPHVLVATSLWVALTDYPAVRWTQRPFMSRTLATRTACYDAHARNWLPDLLQDCGAPSLPPVLAGGEVVGRAHSPRLRRMGVISDSTVVVAGGHDHPMGASLVCSGTAGAILDSMGTAELVYVEGVRPGAGDPFFNASVSILEDKTAWLGVLELSRMLEPMLADEDPLRDLFAAVMDGAPIGGGVGAAGVRFLPGDDTRTFAPRALPAEQLRAVLEAAALLSRILIHRADALAGAAEPGPVYVAGGWARSDTLMQLRADIIGRKLLKIEEPQLSALGSAFVAARGTGELPTHNVATRTFTPDPERTHLYDALLETAGARLEACHAESLINPPRQKPDDDLSSGDIASSQESAGTRASQDEMTMAPNLAERN